MTVPWAVLPPRTLMQRPVFAALTKKLPVWTSGVMLQDCELLPLQPLSTTPVALVPAPASRHLVDWLMGEMVQLLPFGFMVKTEVTRPALASHCWMGDVPASITMLPPVMAVDSAYW